VSYVGAAPFPCDPGAPLRGSGRNQIHNLFGGLGYFGGGAGLIVSGQAFESLAALAPIAEASQRMGQAALLGIFPLSFPSPVRGLVQRGIEFLLFGWIFLVCGALLWHDRMG